MSDKQKKSDLNVYGTGSQGSSGSSTMDMMGNGAFNGAALLDDSKIRNAVRLYTTLVDQSISGDNLSNSGGNDSQYFTDSSGSNGSSPKKNIFWRLEHQFFQRLFQINHVLLSNQAVSVIFFHFILFLSFLQILFNIFYKVEIVNEFSSATVQLKMADTLLNQNVTSSFPLTNDFNIPGNAQSTSQTSTKISTFQIDEFFMFINFQFYVMQGSSSSGFIMVYATLSGFFLLFIILLFAMSGQVFLASKNQSLKESTKIGIRVLSVVMCLFMFLLQIPLTTLILQGFVCDEDSRELLVLSSIKCDSLLHQLLVLFSSLMSVTYLIFLIFQQMLYSSNSFEQEVPWGSFDRSLSSLRVFIKVIIAAGFVFDKSGNYRWQVNIICFCFQMIIVVKRYSNGFIFNSSIFYATIFYEVLSTWLYLVVSFFIITDSTFTVFLFALLILSGVFLAVIIQIFHWRHQSSMMIQDLNALKLETPLHLMIYFYHLYELIEADDQQCELILQGKLRFHMQTCDNVTCQCFLIVESFDDIKKYKKVHMQIEEEENAEKQCRMVDNDMSMANMSMIGDPQTDMMLHIPTAAQLGAFNHLQLPSNRASENICNPLSSRGSAGMMSYQSSNASAIQKRKKSVSISKYKAIQFSGNNANKSVDFSVSNWLAQKKRQAQIEDRFNQLTDRSHHDPSKSKKKWYKYMSIILNEVIEKFPKHINLRIINAFIQKSKLHNEFKAMFEMMNCEICKPSLYEQFIIFRKKIEVEQTLAKQHQKNVQRAGTLDVQQIYEYEQLFQQYQLYEYLTTYAALCFWRELLSKHINASVLQDKGSEISRNYEVIQETAEKLLLIYPEEIKFLFRYGTFLLNIIHNEYDAIESFRKAQTVFQSRINKKSASVPINEQTTFGENSSSAIVIISATSTEIGNIVHANEQIEQVLGFKRSELIGQNVTSLMPRPIGRAHDRLVQRYFETAKPTVIEIKRQLLATSKDGYLKEIELVVKVLPSVSEKLLFVGFIQSNDRFEDMEPPKAEYEKLDKQYIFTDSEGNVTNVTEGLNDDLGMHSKFFHYSDSIFQQKFHIHKISHELVDPDLLEAFESEGAVIEIDTRNILNNIELESLTSEEVTEVRANMCQVQAYVQLKKLVIHPQYCTVHIYRIIILTGQFNEMASQYGKTLITPRLGGNGLISGARATGTGQDLQSNGQSGSGVINQGSKESMDESNNNFAGTAQYSMSSMSSVASTNFQFNRVIKDFKKMLGDRKTPQNLVTLNRIMIVIILISIILSGIDFGILKSQLDLVEKESQHNLFSECRTLKIVELASYVRSFINIANGLEFDRYDGNQLLPFDRYEYLGRLIQQQSQELQEIHEFMTQRRSSVDGSAGDAKVSSFEYQQVEVFRLEESNRVSLYTQPYRVALLTYLNQIQILNGTDRSQIIIPWELITNAPLKKKELKTLANTTQTQKTAYFLMVNGLRSMRTKSLEASAFIKFDSQIMQSISPYVMIMIISIFLTFISCGFILYQLWVIDKNKAEILSLYAMLQMTEIHRVFNQCSSYLEILNQGSIFSQIGQPSPQQQNNHASEEVQSTILIGGVKLSDKKLHGSNFSDILVDSDNQSFDQFGDHSGKLNKKKKNDSLFDDDNESDLHKVIMLKKKKKIHGKKGGKFGKHSKNMNSNDIYAEMIKRTFEEIRMLQESEENCRRVRQLARKNGTGDKGSFEHEGSIASESTYNHNNTKKHHHKKKNENFKSTASQQPSQKKKGLNGTTSGKQQPEIQRNRRKKVDDLVIQFSADEIGTDEERKSPKTINDVSKEQKQGNLSTLEQAEFSAEQQARSKYDLNEKDLEERRRYFFKTIKSKSWLMFLFNIIAAALFSCYYIQLHLYNEYFYNELEHLQNSVPLIYDRFRYTILAYSFARERIIQNRSLDSFELDNEYGHNLDKMSIDNSLKVEKKLNIFMLTQNSITKNLQDQINLIDSEHFCSSMIGTLNRDKSIITQVSSQPVVSKWDIEFSRPYKNELKNLIPAIKAVNEGNLEALKKLQTQGFDLAMTNYDRRNVLHFAAKAGQFEIVKHLILVSNVIINPKDRWDATPMNYAIKYPNIYEFFKKNGGVEGPEQGDYLQLSYVYKFQTLTEGDWSVYYAAYKNDVNALRILKAQNLIDFTVADTDGRTPAGVAASEGSIDALKFLVENGANIAIRDARNNDALSDGKREYHPLVVTYLESIISDDVILDYCTEFSDGLLRKGLQQAIGSFQKKFNDLSIKVNSTSDYDSLLTILSPPANKTSLRKPLETFNLASMKIFFSTSELYYHRIVDKLTTVVLETYSSHISEYQYFTQIIFLIFLAFQIFIILFFRGKLIRTMKADIFQSRGILNLIPDNFFEQNRQKVEKLIKSLKD